jgi:hypothetical protein
MSGDAEDLPRVRRPFRVLAAILGVLMVVGGPVAVYVAVSELRELGFTHENVMLSLSAFGMLPFGLLLLWAAKTGRDETARFDRWMARVITRRD